MSDYDVGESVIRTGHEYLDLVLNGGIHLPSLTLIEGDVQTGKGTLAQSISNEALQEGNGVTYFTSENSPKAIVEQMQAFGMDIMDHITNALFHVPRLQQPVVGDRCEWAVSPERLMLGLIEDLQSNAELRKIIVLDDISDMMRFGEESNVIQMFAECTRLRDEGTTIIALAQSYAIEQDRIDAIAKLCDVHMNLETTGLGDHKGTLLTVHKANNKSLDARNTVAFRIVNGQGIKTVDVPRTAASSTLRPALGRAAFTSESMPPVRFQALSRLSPLHTIRSHVCIKLAC